MLLRLALISERRRIAGWKAHGIEADVLKTAVEEPGCKQPGQAQEHDDARILQAETVGTRNSSLKSMTLWPSHGPRRSAQFDES